MPSNQGMRSLKGLGIFVFNLIVATLFPLVIIPIIIWLVGLFSLDPPEFLSNPIIHFFIGVQVFISLLIFESISFVAIKLSESEQNISSIVTQNLEEGFKSSATIRLLGHVVRAREMDESESKYIGASISTLIDQIEKLHPPLSLVSIWLISARIGSFVDDIAGVQRGHKIAMSVQEQINLSAFLTSISSRYVLIESVIHEGGTKNWTTGFGQFCEYLSKERALNKDYFILTTHKEVKERAGDVRNIIDYFSKYGIDVFICEPGRLMDAFALEQQPSSVIEYFEGPKGKIVAHYRVDGKGYKGGKGIDLTVVERTEGSRWDKIICTVLECSELASNVLESTQPND